MPILRLRDAAYDVRGRQLAPPVTFDVEPANRVSHVCGNATHARILAMMASALVRATSGSVLIGEYDPRVQPVHCKRLVGYVPHDPLPLAQMPLDRYIEYRAALWDIDAERARAHARLLLERLAPLHEAFAIPVVAALLPFPQLLVLDRPQAVYAGAILAAAGPIAVFSTHLDEATAARYAAPSTGSVSA